MGRALIGGLLTASPSLVGWIVALVLAVIMLRRGGGRAERLLVAGISLMLVNTLITIPMGGLAMWLSDTGMSVGTVLSRVLWVRGLISLAGIVCLVYAFWTRFKVNYDNRVNT